MIQINEIRIGNLVTDRFWDSFKTVLKVESINSKGINLEITDDGNWSELAQHFMTPEYEFENLFGIPLTPEILKQFGFEDDEITISKGMIWLAEGEKGYDVFLNGLSGEVFMTINHVHQLQNIHFVMTGKELNVTTLSK